MTRALAPNEGPGQRWLPALDAFRNFCFSLLAAVERELPDTNKLLMA